MSDYDAVVIGTGTAGQTAAYELKARGLTVRRRGKKYDRRRNLRACRMPGQKVVL